MPVQVIDHAPCRTPGWGIRGGCVNNCDVVLSWVFLKSVVDRDGFDDEWVAGFVVLDFYGDAVEEFPVAFAECVDHISGVLNWEFVFVETVFGRVFV